MSIIIIQFIFNIGSFIDALQEEMVGLQNKLKLLCCILKLNTYLYWKYKVKIINQLQILPILQVIFLRTEKLRWSCQNHNHVL